MLDLLVLTAAVAAIPNVVAHPNIFARTSCTVNSGLTGSCMNTSSCSAGGGTSEAGHCPGPTDFQCCTFGTCSVNSGASGVCIATGDCSSLGGTSEAGHCPGPTDIQCCATSGGDDGGDSGCGVPDVNDATISLIKEFEGFVESPDPDPIGLPTVGYGHLCEETDCAEVPYSFPLSEDTATQLLIDDLPSYQDGVAGALDSSVVLNDNQFGALVSWCFNNGVGAVEDSTLIARLNAGEDPNTVAEEELPKWVYAGGQVFSGLVRRRDAEVALFQTASDVQALPPSC